MSDVLAVGAVSGMAGLVIGIFIGSRLFAGVDHVSQILDRDPWPMWETIVGPRDPDDPTDEGPAA